MELSRRLNLKELLPELTCRLCRGYFVDAFTVVECLHSFCKSCIMAHVKKTCCCPTCGSPFNQARLTAALRPDQTLQSVVYKLVPHLFNEEMQRRRRFYHSHQKRDRSLSPERRGEVSSQQFVCTLTDPISFSLEYHRYDGEEVPGDCARRRYLRAPAGLSISHLRRLLLLKHDLPAPAQVDILFGGDRLSEDLLIMDVACMYSWDRTAPMRFFYRYTTKRAAAEVPAPSSVAQPTAPPSKRPRLTAPVIAVAAPPSVGDAAEGDSDKENIENGRCAAEVPPPPATATAEPAKPAGKGDTTTAAAASPPEATTPALEERSQEAGVGVGDGAGEDARLEKGGPGQESSDGDVKLATTEPGETKIDSVMETDNGAPDASETNRADVTVNGSAESESGVQVSCSAQNGGDNVIQSDPIQSVPSVTKQTTAVQASVGTHPKKITPSKPTPMLAPKFKISSKDKHSKIKNLSSVGPPKPAVPAISNQLSQSTQKIPSSNGTTRDRTDTLAQKTPLVSRPVLAGPPSSPKPAPATAAAAGSGAEGSPAGSRPPRDVYDFDADAEDETAVRLKTIPVSSVSAVPRSQLAGPPRPAACSVSAARPQSAGPARVAASPVSRAVPPPTSRYGATAAGTGRVLPMVLPKPPTPSAAITRPPPPTSSKLTTSPAPVSRVQTLAPSRPSAAVPAQAGRPPPPLPDLPGLQSAVQPSTAAPTSRGGAVTSAMWAPQTVAAAPLRPPPAHSAAYTPLASTAAVGSGSVHPVHLPALFPTSQAPPPTPQVAPGWALSVASTEGVSVTRVPVSAVATPPGAASVAVAAVPASSASAAASVSGASAALASVPSSGSAAPTSVSGPAAAGAARFPAPGALPASAPTSVSAVSPGSSSRRSLAPLPGLRPIGAGAIPLMTGQLDRFLQMVSRSAVSQPNGSWRLPADASSLLTRVSAASPAPRAAPAPVSAPAAAGKRLQPRPPPPPTPGSTRVSGTRGIQRLVTNEITITKLPSKAAAGRSTSSPKQGRPTRPEVMVQGSDQRGGQQARHHRLPSAAHPNGQRARPGRPEVTRPILPASGVQPPTPASAVPPGLLPPQTTSPLLSPPLVHSFTRTPPPPGSSGSVRPAPPPTPVNMLSPTAATTSHSSTSNGGVTSGDRLTSSVTIQKVPSPPAQSPASKTSANSPQGRPPNSPKLLAIAESLALRKLQSQLQPTAAGMQQQPAAAAGPQRPAVSSRVRQIPNPSLVHHQSQGRLTVLAVTPQEPGGAGSPGAASLARMQRLTNSLGSQ